MLSYLQLSITCHRTWGDNELSRTLQSIDTFIMSKIPAVQQALQKSTSVQDIVSPVMTDKEFEELMASYEAFFDEYVDLMKKVQKNPTNAELLAAYSSYMARYADMMAKLESWDDKELTTARKFAIRHDVPHQSEANERRC